MSAARVADRGYQRYEGERAGHGHAVRSLIAHTLRRILGLRRPARTKILPVLTIAIAYVPAIVFIGVEALIPGDFSGTFIPHYSEYYGFVISAILLFVTFVAPEALCPDQRYRVLSIYLAAPLTRQSYVWAKAAAVLVVLCTVTIGPPLILLLGLMFQNAGPDGFDGVLAVLGRMLASGVAVALYYTAVSIGVASITDRRAIASAATLLLLLASNIAAGVLSAISDDTRFILLSLTRTPFALVRVIYGREPLFFEQVSAGAVWGAAIAVTALGAAVCFVRYRTLQVTR